MYDEFSRLVVTHGFNFQASRLYKSAKSILRLRCASKSSALSVSCTMPSMMALETIPPFIDYIDGIPPIFGPFDDEPPLYGLLPMTPEALRRREAPRSGARAFLGLGCCCWY